MNIPFSKKHISVPGVPASRIFREIGRNAHVDWIVTILFSLIVILILAFGGGYLYMAVIHADAANDADSPAASKPFDAKNFSDFTKTLDARSATTDAVKKGYSASKDPSQ